MSEAIAGTLLTGARAVVTGASRGVGEAVARSLVAAGAQVALIARGPAALEGIARSLGNRAFGIPCDVRDSTAVQRAVAKITERFEGAPTILVNNAGVFPFAPLQELTIDEFAAAVDANLIAPFRFIRGLLPAMQAARHGHIVTIGSAADRAAFPGNGAYAPTKFGARALHEVLRGETRGTGVRATLVSPGPIDTAIWDAVDPDNRDGKSGLPRRSEMLRPVDVARTVLFALTQPAHVNIDELRVSFS